MKILPIDMVNRLRQALYTHKAGVNSWEQGEAHHAS